MSCAWNNYCIAVKHKIEATKLLAAIGNDFKVNDKSNPVLQMLGEMCKETALYFYMDGMIFERDNYITMIEDDMEANGDSWIYYMAGTLQDKTLFEWLRVYMRIPFELKEEWKAKIRESDYKYEKRAGRVK
jgi:hypothetical protein